MAHATLSFEKLNEIDANACKKILYCAESEKMIKKILSSDEKRLQNFAKEVWELKQKNPNKTVQENYGFKIIGELCQKG